jgi:hypothetical protein
MRERQLADSVREQIVGELQTPGVREIVHRALAQELLTGVPADSSRVAKQIYEHVKERILSRDSEAGNAG